MKCIIGQRCITNSIAGFGSSVTGALPGPGCQFIAPGDVIFADLKNGAKDTGVGSITGPAGWTQVAMVIADPGSNKGTLHSIWRFTVTTNPPFMIPLTWTFSNVMYYDLRMAVYVGLDPVNPVDVFGTAGSGNTIVSSLILPSLTPSGSGETLYASWGWWQPPFGIHVGPPGLTQEWYDSPTSFMGSWMGDLFGVSTPTSPYQGLFGP